MRETELKGKIIKGIGGFYYVYVNGAGLYECKAKGIFRKNSEKPLVGDECSITVTDEEKRIATIERLLPRRNRLIRPEVANVDQALVIFALSRPEPNFNLLDRFLIHMESRQIPCIICFNKEDLVSADRSGEILAAYERSGHTLCVVSAKTGNGIRELKERLSGKTTTVAGPSGVGKSSLINELLGSRKMETGSISEKINRGKHTTRHSELFYTDMCGKPTFLFDTPGFSSLDVPAMEDKSLASFYHEFDVYEPNCRFGGCAHIKEKDCGVKDAVEKGYISRLRYTNYVRLYEEEKSRRRY